MTLSEILADPGYQELKQYVLTHTGLHYYQQKDEDFSARLSRRLMARGAGTCSKYLGDLRQERDLHHEHRKPSEIDALVGELTIGETYFFRQIEHFDMLRETIIPLLIRQNQTTRQLRIWSAGCATGPEPYSVAMLLDREFAGPLHGWNVYILGTDINLDFLEQARTGVFSNWAMREIPDELRACCFAQTGKTWTIHASLRKAVSFRYHNLTDELSHPAADHAPFDLILCRNVMIYFAAERIRSLGQLFHRLLRPGGWLLPGHAEYSSEMFSQFDLIPGARATVYRKPAENEERETEAPWQPWVMEDRPMRPDSPQGTWLTEPVVVPAPASVSKPPASATAAEHSAPEHLASEKLEAARLLADKGQVGEAAAICRSILDNDPLNAPAHFTLGLILSHANSGSDAVSHLRKAIYADRNFTLAHYHLGTLLQSGGELTAARKAFGNTLELLRSVPPGELLAHGDGIQASELQELAEMHWKLIR